MPDPRTDLYNVLSRRLTEEMVARDEAWADYWQRRRVVVVPEKNSDACDAAITHEYNFFAGDDAVQYITARAHDIQKEMVIRTCIARLKAAREKEAVNKNLSTLLAVVVKVQRDLETLLNGQRAE